VGIWSNNPETGGLLRSTNNGDTWIKVGAGMTSTYIQSLAINSEDNIFIGIWDAGVYCSTDKGTNCIDINTGLPTDGVRDFAINSKGEIFVGTNGNGIYKSTHTTTSIEKKKGKFPCSNFLKQNYPNPFNPKTVISWHLAAGSNVELSIYNLLGQKIENLINKYMQAGYHEVEFSGQNLSSGIYLYRIQAGDFQEVKKMMLLQ
jgi:hypothetical protein